MDCFGVHGSDGRWQVLPATYDDIREAGLAADPQELVAQLQLLDVLDEDPEGWVLDPVVAEAAGQLVR
jgi:hypothetical protein